MYPSLISLLEVNIYVQAHHQCYSRGKYLSLTNCLYLYERALWFRIPSSPLHFDYTGEVFINLYRGSNCFQTIRYQI